MDKYFWKDQSWVLKSTFPIGTHKLFLCLGLFFFFILGFIFFYPYCVYKQYYGIVEKDGEGVIKIIVPLKEVEIIEKAIQNDDGIELISVDPNVQVESYQSFILMYVKISISKKQMIQNNVIPVKLKIEEITFFEEFYQKWKRGMKQ